MAWAYCAAAAPYRASSKLAPALHPGAPTGVGSAEKWRAACSSWLSRRAIQPSHWAPAASTLAAERPPDIRLDLHAATPLRRRFPVARIDPGAFRGAAAGVRCRRTRAEPETPARAGACFVLLACAPAKLRWPYPIRRQRPKLATVPAWPRRRRSAIAFPEVQQRSFFRQTHSQGGRLRLHARFGIRDARPRRQFDAIEIRLRLERHSQLACRRQRNERRGQQCERAGLHTELFRTRYADVRKIHYKRRLLGKDGSVHVHSGAQHQAIGLVDQDLNRNALNDFDEITRGVLRREQAQAAARGARRWNPRGRPPTVRTCPL